MNVTLIVAWVKSLALWFVQNPTITAPLVGALITMVCKPRTPQQYAAMAMRYPTWLWIRIAAMLQLIAAIFPDPIKARKIVFKLIYANIDPIDPMTGSKSAPPPPMPSAPPTKKEVERSWLGRRIGFAASALLLIACTKQQLLGAGDLFLQKVMCAISNSDLPNDKIIEKCAIQPGDVNRILEIVGEHRQQAAKAAAKAVEESKSAKPGCSGSRDGGI